MSVQDPVFAYARAWRCARGSVVHAFKAKPGFCMTLLSNRLWKGYAQKYAFMGTNILMLSQKSLASILWHLQVGYFFMKMLNNNLDLY